ncbi:MAG: DHHA1 domain-containing protein [Desulfurococcales archaeon]|nr:DHHA1 domain-containing protein [Desulfurococcales archaeon]
MNHLYIVTHTDLDGIASAAAALRVSGRSLDHATIIYADPYNIHEKLIQIKEHVEDGDYIVISDLGPSRDSFKPTVDIIRDITGRGARVYWYDHHVWGDDEVKAASDAGAVLRIDRGTCATGVVARYMPADIGAEGDEFLSELESAVCAADLWRWDHHLAPKLFRVAENRRSEEWKNTLAAKFSSGVLWDEELEEALRDYIARELEGYNKIVSMVYVTEAPCRVAAAYKKFRGPPSNSMIGALLQGRYMPDIAVILRSNGGISLRSKRVNVQVVAARLGGGGHPAAAGAKIRMPLLVRLISWLAPRYASRYAANLVRSVAIESGVCGGRG